MTRKKVGDSFDIFLMLRCHLTGGEEMIQAGAELALVVNVACRRRCDGVREMTVSLAAVSLRLELT